MPKISQLPTTTTVSDPDVLPIVQSGTTKRILYTDFTDQVTTDVLAAVNTQVTAAENAASAAAISATAAQTAETNAELAETNAEAAQTAAQTAQTNAELAETSAEGHAASAATYASTAAINANAYDTIAAGLAATASGSSFIVKAGGSDALMRPTLYKDNAGVAESILPLLPATEYDAMRQQLAGVGSMPDKGPIVTPVVTNNITDASAITTTVTPESTGVRINQSTASRLVAYSSLMKTGGEHTRIVQTVALTTAASNNAVGLSFGSGSTRRTVVYQLDGSIRSMLGEDTSMSNDAQGGSTYTSGDTVTIRYDLMADGTLLISARKGSGKELFMGYSSVPQGEVAIAMYGTTNAVHSFEVSSLSTVQEMRADRNAELYGVSTTERANLNALIGLVDQFRRSQPSGITATLPLNFKVYKKISSRSFYTNIDLQPPLALDDPTNAVVYVDIATGNDSNQGTASAPFQNLPAAQAAIKFAPKATIMVKGGNYYHNAALDTSTHTFSNTTLQIVSWDGNPVYISRHITGLTWTPTGSGAYSADAGAASTWFNTYGCAGVLDSKASRQTANGDYEVLTAAASQAACDATPGTYFRSGTTIYVHTTDNRLPDSDIRVVPAQIGSGSYGVAGGTVYLEGLRLDGGGYPWRITGNSTTNGVTCYARDCWFRHGLVDDSFNWVSVGTCVLQNCVAAKAFTDGFSFTTYSTGAGPVAVLIDCIGRDNGRTTGQTNQGATMHSGGTLVVVNGDYFSNQNANIHSVQSAMSWLLGVTCRNTQSATDGNIGIGDLVAYLDSCTTSGGPYDINCVSGSVCNIYDFVGSTSNTGTGTIQAYTP